MTKKTGRRIYLKDFRIISRAISTYEDIPLLFDHIAKLIVELFKVKGCSLMLFDEREKQLFRVSSVGVSEEYLNKGPIYVDPKYSALAKGEPVFIKNVLNDPRVQYPEEAAKEGIASILSIPIKFRNVVVGIMRIYHSEAWDLHEDDLDSFCVIADHLGLVIEYNGLKNFFEHVKLGFDRLPPRLLEGL